MRSNLWMLALLAGCASGGIRTDEVDGLDGIRDAVWIEWEREIEGNDDVWHEFVLSSHGGLCRDLQELVPELADLYDDFARDVQSSPDDECSLLENFYEDAAELTEKFYARPMTTLSLTLRDGDDDPEDPPPEDSYDQGYDGNDPWFTGTLTQVESNPYAELADAVGDCSNLDDNLDDAIDDVTERWIVDRGDAEVFERGDEHYRIELDGDLEDEDGDDAGEILARGTYAHCVVTWEGWFEPF